MAELVQISNPFKIRTCQGLGNYALDVHWDDGHHSIFTYDQLRVLQPPPFDRPSQKSPLAGAGQAKPWPLKVKVADGRMMVSWSDGYDAIYTMDALRRDCQCAECIPHHH
ncbi:MAG: DUF971 domain-containing protein [Deltaproteobacteria bacterium]|nr:DUF971 domain-containing protein [Deltaproteobacteria bacterium]